MPSPPRERTAEQGKHPQVSEETLLKITKEIVIKFIEVGRLTPATFDQVFKEIHTTVRDSALSGGPE